MTIEDMAEMVRSGGIRGFEALVHSLGGDPNRLLRRHRISVRSLRNEDALIPFRLASEMVEEAAAVLGCPDFGLRLARHYDPTILGPLAVAIQHSATVEEALRWASRYLFVQTPAMAIHLSVRGRQPKLAELRLEFLTRGWSVHRQTIDACLAGWHFMAQALARDHLRLQAVCLPHQPVAPLSVYRRLFGAPVRVAQPHAALLYPADALSARLRHPSKTLQGLAGDYLRAHYQAPPSSVTQRVRAAITQTIGLTPVKRPQVAAMMAMHPRTLQRHLLSEGTCYESILDDVRRNTAQRYLDSTQVPLKQLAGLLGFSQQSVLTRSCRRWFDATPTQMRTKARMPPVP